LIIGVQGATNTSLISKCFYVNYCTIQVRIFKNFSSTIYEALCEPLKIPGGPPLVHLDNVENHCSKLKQPFACAIEKPV